MQGIFRPQDLRATVGHPGLLDLLYVDGKPLLGVELGAAGLFLLDLSNGTLTREALGIRAAAAESLGLEFLSAPENANALGRHTLSIVIFDQGPAVAIEGRGSDGFPAELYISLADGKQIFGKHHLAGALTVKHWRLSWECSGKRVTIAERAPAPGAR